MKTHAEISKEAAPEDKKEEPISEKLELHMGTRTTPSIDFSKSNRTNERSMSSAKPLRKFLQMG
jgi:hypothetical protein